MEVENKTKCQIMNTLVLRLNYISYFFVYSKYIYIYIYILGNVFLIPLFNPLFVINKLMKRYQTIFINTLSKCIIEFLSLCEKKNLYNYDGCYHWDTYTHIHTHACYMCMCESWWISKKMI